MDKEKVKSTILNIILSEECQKCHEEGIHCQLKPGSRERIVTFDFQPEDTLTLLPMDYDCDVRTKGKNIQQNADKLRALRRELKEQT